MTSLPAGWYYDSVDPAFLRFWDGYGWSPHTVPTPQLSPSRLGAPWVFGLQAGFWVLMAVFGLAAHLPLFALGAALLSAASLYYALARPRAEIYLDLAPRYGMGRPGSLRRHALRAVRLGVVPADAVIRFEAVRLAKQRVAMTRHMYVTYPLNLLGFWFMTVGTGFPVGFTVLATVAFAVSFVQWAVLRTRSVRFLDRLRTHPPP